MSISTDSTVISRCIECRTLQRERTAHGRTCWETWFAAKCSSCGEATELVALVPMITIQTLDKRDWCVRKLKASEIKAWGTYFAAVAEGEDDYIPPITAYCPECECEEIEDEGITFDDVRETHLPAKCPVCRSATGTITLLPVAVHPSWDGQEWFVIELEEHEIELVRHRLDAFAESWPS